MTSCKLIELNGFCDFNICGDYETRLKDLVLKALKLGYENIAINKTVSDDIPAKKSKKGSFAGIPEPTIVNLKEKELLDLGIKLKPKIFSRLTIRITDPSSPFLHKAKDAIKKYDIIAFTPLTEAAFKHLCQASVELDILSFDFNDSQFKLSRKLLSLMAKADIYYELSYSPCIRSSSIRKVTIQTAYELHSYARSKNIIITSGANQPSELRNPYDVMNLGLLFGLTAAGSKAAVSRSALEMLYCSQMRRTGRSKCSARVFLADKSEKSALASLYKLDKIIT